MQPGSIRADFVFAQLQTHGMKKNGNGPVTHETASIPIASSRTLDFFPLHRPFP